MKVAVLGGGGFRVPLVYGALLERAPELRLGEVTLHDVDAERTARIQLVLEGLEQERGTRLPVRATTSLADAVEGADFVFCAIRVGNLEGRVIDEQVPLGEGVVGQETTGPGGICFALRTVPVMLDIASTVAERAPGAWLVNFTNPAGLVTEAVQEVLGGRAIGICDTPSSLCKRVGIALGREPDALWFDYFGLNHLGWLRGVYDGDENLLPSLLADDARLATLEEGRLFGAEWLRTLGMIPNEYLYFYYFASEAVGAVASGLQPRAEFLLRQQSAFYAANGHSPHEALAAWRATRAERDATYFEEARRAAGLVGHAPEWTDPGGYEGEAMAVVEAIALEQRTVLIVDTANRSALPFLDETAVVEVPCVLSGAGAVPTAVGRVPTHARALIETLKEVERTTIRAAVTGSRRLAVEALALHPLVPSVPTAQRIFAAYMSRQPDLAERFGP